VGDDSLAVFGVRYLSWGSDIMPSRGLAGVSRWSALLTLFGFDLPATEERLVGNRTSFQVAWCAGRGV
jgi:hypothetical protein